MVELGALAYPVVLAAMYGVFCVGRSERWGAFEWMRLAALAGLAGFIVAIQVKLAMIGAMASPLAKTSAAMSLGGVACLLGLYLWERWQRQHEGAPAADGQGRVAG